MRRSLRRGLFVLVPLVLLSAAGWAVYRHARQARLDDGLVAAVRTDDLTRVKALLDEGADPDARPQAPPGSLWERLRDRLRRRNRPLGDAVTLTAAEQRRWPIVEALLRHGANPNLRTNAGGRWPGRTPLMYAAHEANLHVVSLLLQHRAHANDEDDTGRTALALACSRQGDGYLRAARMLLAGGADPNRGSALQCATHDAPDAVALLLARGADPNRAQFWMWAIARGTTTALPQTALAIAAWDNRAGVARLLLRHGADPTMKNADGSTAAQLATDPAMRCLLRRAEADWRRRHPTTAPDSRRPPHPLSSGASSSVRPHASRWSWA